MNISKYSGSAYNISRKLFNTNTDDSFKGKGVRVAFTWSADGSYIKKVM